MAVSIISITNISHQVVTILYGNTTAGDSRSKFAYNLAGEMVIAPGASTDIEEGRVDAGQLESLKRKGLLTTTVR